MSENTNLLNCPTCEASFNPPVGQSVRQCPYCHQAADNLQEIEHSTHQTLSPSGKGGRLVIVAFLLLIGAVAVFLSACGNLNSLAQPSPSPTSTPTSKPTVMATPLFSKKLLVFGSEGTGPGELNQPASIRVDRAGNIYVGNSEDGHINVFDPMGNFLRLINLGANTAVKDMDVASDGSIYACQSGQIFKLDARGNGTPLVYDTDPNERVYFEHFVIGADDSLVASTEDDQIIRFNADGKVVLVIQKVFASVIGTGSAEMYLAVDQQGNIYVLSYEAGIVLKYSPNGEFLHQFGGKASDKTSGVTPGRFSVPLAIAVDGYGRIFVSDRWGVQVFSPNGQYLNSFKISGSAFGMTFDAKGNLYLATNEPQVVVMQLQKPQ